MGKKKSSAKPTSSTSSSIAQLFLQMQNKSSQWYDKEREGISLIEGFQTALNACRDEMAMDTRSTNGDDKVLTSLTSLGGNTQMDPLLVEDLFAQVKELKQDFDKLLHEMYDLHLEARTIVLTSGDDNGEAATGVTLTPIDYFQFIGQELAAYEAEYQHVEALLEMISFDISPDQLRTLVISWSTSPFLNPEQSREFRKRHESVHSNE